MRRENMTQDKWVYGLVVALAALILLAASACRIGPPPTQNTTTPALPTATSKPPPDAAVIPVADAQVQRRLAKVWAGTEAAGHLPELVDEGWHAFQTGSMVTTDDHGEGCVQFEDCMMIYIFRTSKLRKSACPKSSRTGGNVTCAEEGTSAFNNQCAGQITIQTLSMQVELHGTWVAISYLPGWEVSVVQVFEGSATVWPVLDAEVYTLGDGSQVTDGQAYFTVPDAKLGLWPDLPMRTPLDELHPWIADLIQPWQDLVLAQAARDGVLPPTPTPTTTPTVTPTFTPTPTSTPCGPPPGWRQYTVQRGDTLHLLAQRNAVSIEAIRNANCRPGDDIYVGELLWLPPDTNPPPAPTPLEPSDGAEFDCPVAPIGLALHWSEVGDESGIAGYFIQLEPVVLETPDRPVPTPVQVGPIGGTVFETGLDCGWAYRWRVRAQDGAGNTGPWSDWSEFWVLAEVPPLPDLVITQFYGPELAQPGESIGDRISLAVANRGNAAAGGFFVDIVISPDPDIDVSDTLLVGGREYVEWIEPGEQVAVAMAAEIIPEDWPTGYYTIGAILDPFEDVAELDERNNTAAFPIVVTTPDQPPTSVSITSPATDSGTWDDEYGYDGYDYGRDMWYTDVSLEGSAYDPEDGWLGGYSLEWITNRDDLHGDPVLGYGTNPVVRLYSNQECETEGTIGDWHIIALIATDSGGNTAKDVRRIYIWRVCVF